MFRSWFKSNNIKNINTSTLSQIELIYKHFSIFIFVDLCRTVLDNSVYFRIFYILSWKENKRFNISSANGLWD